MNGWHALLRGQILERHLLPVSLRGWSIILIFEYITKQKTKSKTAQYLTTVS